MLKEKTSLIDIFLEEQAFTAVEKFSKLHDEVGQFSEQQSFYKDLIPLEAPASGQQFAFEVDLDRCTGCKTCVTACHSMNGLGYGETWRSVGLVCEEAMWQPVQAPVYPRITFIEFEQEPDEIETVTNTCPIVLPSQQHVTTACHHCLEPGCLAGCPVKAYEKNPTTGIVKHLDDQCIGCKYCVLMCPYGVPQYNKTEGIVRKCDMCGDRLAVGEAPACVQGCPNQAIKISLVETTVIREKPFNYVTVPNAPNSQHTLPTTVFNSTRDLVETMQASDHYHLEPWNPEYPLLFMLILTQLSAGIFLVEIILSLFSQTTLLDNLIPFITFAALISGIAGIGAAQLHLGRPFYSFRAILGFRKSWVSREIIAGGLFVTLSAIYSFLHWKYINAVPILLLSEELQSFIGVIGVLLAGSAILAVSCSAMVYQSTPRPFWANYRPLISFFLSTVTLGVSTFLFITGVATLQYGLNLTQLMRDFGNFLCVTLIFTSIISFVYEQRFFTHSTDKELTSLKKSVFLMWGELNKAVQIRFVSRVAGIFVPIALLNNSSAVGLVVIASLLYLLIILGELSERYLFFTCAIPTKMPGLHTGRTISL